MICFIKILPIPLLMCVFLLTHNSTQAHTDNKERAQLHARVKRQYFKPSIDGSWLGNERVTHLNHVVTNLKEEDNASNKTIRDTENKTVHFKI